MIAMYNGHIWKHQASQSVSLFPYHPASDGKVIANSDYQIFSNKGPNSQNSH